MAKVRVKTLNFTRLKKKLLQAPIELRREVWDCWRPARLLSRLT